MEQHFTATVYTLGINPCVDVPPRVSAAFGKRGYVPVAGTLNDQPIRATLAPKGGGRHRNIEKLITRWRQQDESQA